MRLTAEQIEAIRLRADSGFTVDDDDWNALCDMALATLVAEGLEKMAMEQRDKALTVPRYAGPLLPDPMRRIIERECDDAEHPSGMSVHDGRTRVHSSHVRRLLSIIDRLLHYR